MEKFKLVRINTGNAVHLAEYFKTPQGIEGYDVYCGSGKTGFRVVMRETYREVALENIDCKKCKKRYIEKMKEMEVAKPVEEKEMTMEEIKAELKKMKESGKGFTIPK